MYPFLCGLFKGSVEMMKNRLEYNEPKNALIEARAMIAMYNLFQEKSPTSEKECWDLFQENYEAIMEEAKKI